MRSAAREAGRRRSATTPSASARISATSLSDNPERTDELQERADAPGAGAGAIVQIPQRLGVLDDAPPGRLCGLVRSAEPAAPPPGEQQHADEKLQREGPNRGIEEPADHLGAAASVERLIEDNRLNGPEALEQPVREHRVVAADQRAVAEEIVRAHHEDMTETDLPARRLRLSPPREAHTPPERVLELAPRLPGDVARGNQIGCDRGLGRRLLGRLLGPVVIQRRDPDAELPEIQSRLRETRRDEQRAAVEHPPVEIVPDAPSGVARGTDQTEHDVGVAELVGEDPGVDVASLGDGAETLDEIVEEALAGQTGAVRVGRRRRLAGEPPRDKHHEQSEGGEPAALRKPPRSHPGRIPS